MADRQVYAEHTKVPDSPCGGSQYSDAMTFHGVLGTLGPGNWESVNAGETGFAKAAKAATSKGTPVIADVVWNRRGPHFVVLDAF
jgi:hypothetical protein